MKSKFKSFFYYLLIGFLLSISILFMQTFIPMLTKAYSSSTESQIGSYSMSFDKSKYYDDNLISLEYDIVAPPPVTNIIRTSFDYDSNSITLLKDSCPSVDTCFNVYVFPSLESGTYYLNYDIDLVEDNGIIQLIFGYYNKNNLSYVSAVGSYVYEQNNNYSQTITYDNDNYYYGVSIYYRAGWWNSSKNWNSTKSINHFMISKSPITTFSNKFMFGYIVSSSGRINNETSSSLSGSYSVVACDSSALIDSSCYFSKNITISANSSYSVEDIRNVYIPFKISETGNVSFNADLSFSHNFRDNQTSENFNFSLIPIFQATLIDSSNYANHIYLTQNYIFNSISISGLQLTSYSSSYVDSNFINIVQNNYNKPLTLSSNVKYYISDSYSLNSIVSSNHFSTSYFFNDSFIISIDLDRNNLVNYLTIDSFNLLVVGDSSISPPTNISTGDYENYKTCSAWYDLPCQASNAFTFVVYNVPLLSPIFKLAKSINDTTFGFISLLNTFNGFGVIFSCGVVALIILIIKKSYGGD